MIYNILYLYYIFISIFFIFSFCDISETLAYYCFNGFKTILNLDGVIDLLLWSMLLIGPILMVCSDRCGWLVESWWFVLIDVVDWSNPDDLFWSMWLIGQILMVCSDRCGWLVESWWLVLIDVVDWSNPDGWFWSMWLIGRILMVGPDRCGWLVESWWLVLIDVVDWSNPDGWFWSMWLIGRILMVGSDRCCWLVESWWFDLIDVVDWLNLMFIFFCQSWLQKDTASVRLKEDLEAAWLAVQCAASISNSQRSRRALVSNDGSLLKAIGKDTSSNVPDFLALDLVGSLVLGEKMRVFKSTLFSIL